MTQKFKAYALRTCKADMTSRNGFKWPESGPVECYDWEPDAKCGNGLHGALNGQGDGSLFNWSRDAVWQVVGIDEWVDLGGKVKFPRGIVLHTGNQNSATEFLSSLGHSHAVIGGTATAGYRGTATAGDYGTATAGDYGTIVIKFYDNGRMRLLVGYIGEDGLKPDTPYKVENGKFVEATT